MEHLWSVPLRSGVESEQQVWGEHQLKLIRERSSSDR